jgi:hypothetical protein
MLPGQPGLAIKGWMSVLGLVAALGLIVAGNVIAVGLVISSDNQGRPAPAQIVGTWTDSQGATLQVLHDGNFAAAGLPADANDPAGDGRPHPTVGHGTWQITRWQGAWDVGFTFGGGSQFQLAYLGSAGSRANAGTATFSWVFPQFNAVDLWYFYRTADARTPAPRPGR